jgi:hypothetical protein
MKNYSIEVDQEVWDYLKRNAEPFVDTPNSVLRRILFRGRPANDSDVGEGQSSTNPLSLPSSMPRALAQILEVIYEVKKRGKPRNEATNIVAERRKTAPQTVIDKYCRQLGKRAYEIDRLLLDRNTDEFEALLQSRFTGYQGLISSFFSSLKNGEAVFSYEVPYDGH